jgi:hypothetical protein
LDADDECGADRGEQTGLRTWSTLLSDKWNVKTHENQGCVEILVVFLHIFGVIFCRLSFIHGVEIELGVVGLDRLEVHPESVLESVLDAVWSQLVGPRNGIWIPGTHHRGSTFTGFAFSASLIVASCRRVGGEVAVLWELWLLWGGSKNKNLIHVAHALCLSAPVSPRMCQAAGDACCDASMPLSELTVVVGSNERKSLLSRGSRIFGGLYIY